jgi:hypothetical protein
MASDCRDRFYGLGRTVQYGPCIGKELIESGVAAHAVLEVDLDADYPADVT